jgi:hypothetical protein
MLSATMVGGWHYAQPMVLNTDLAGMDGNRTHLGPVIGAPRTVLKTVFSPTRGSAINDRFHLDPDTNPLFYRYRVDTN